MIVLPSPPQNQHWTRYDPKLQWKLRGKLTSVLDNLPWFKKYPKIKRMWCLGVVFRSTSHNWINLNPWVVCILSFYSCNSETCGHLFPTAPPARTHATWKAIQSLTHANKQYPRCPGSSGLFLGLLSIGLRDKRSECFMQRAVIWKAAGGSCDLLRCALFCGSCGRWSPNSHILWGICHIDINRNYPLRYRKHTFRVARTLLLFNYIPPVMVCALLAEHINHWFYFDSVSDICQTC